MHLDAIKELQENYEKSLKLCTDLEEACQKQSDLLQRYHNHRHNLIDEEKAKFARAKTSIIVNAICIGFMVIAQAILTCIYLLKVIR